MQRLNARVKLDRETGAQVAADWHGVDSPEGRSRAQRIWRRTVEHLALVGISLGLALLLALPLGIIAARRPRLGQVVLTVTGLLQTLPSLAVFVFMIPLFGIGAGPRSEEHTSELQSLMRISYAVFCLQQKNIKSTQL